MPATPQKTRIAAMSFEFGQDGAAQTEAHLLPPGPFRSVDVRPVECAAWQLDAAIAARVIALAAGKKTDIVVDFEHQGLRSAENGRRNEAAGWIPRTLEWREGSGLWAVGIKWVGDTADLIAAKKYRYISALFAYSTVTGEVLEIVAVTLTNTPGIDGLEALADLSRTFTHPEEDAAMADEKNLAALTAERDGLNTQVAALTAERDGLNTKLAALATERDTLKTQVTTLEQEKATAALATEKAKHAEVMAAALTDGRLTPAQKPWAEKQSLAALTEYLDATKPLPIAGAGQAVGHQGGGVGLTDAELAMCSRMGVTPEDFKKAKALA